MKDVGHGDGGAVKLSCLGCAAPMSFGSSECFECGTRYRYVEGRAVAENLDQLELDEAADRAAREAAARTSATGFHPPPGDRKRVPASGVRSRRGLALGTVLALGATQVLALLNVGLEWLLAFVVARGHLTAPFSKPFETILWFGSARFAGIMLVEGAAAVLFMLWMRDSNRVARALGVEGLRYTPAACIYYWFIPVLNFLRPYAVVVELWRASEPRAGVVDWRRARVSRVLPWWWGTWVLGYVFIPWRAVTLYSWRLANVAWFLATALELVCASLAAWIVWKVHERLEEKAGPIS